MVVAEYVGRWSRSPEPGSNFVRSVGHLPNISDAELAIALRKKGYDGLLYVSSGEIVGHMFFQRHDTELHAFSAWAAESHRGEKLMGTASMDFVAYAWACPKTARARVGTGHSLTEHLLAPLRPVVASLGWCLVEGGWIDFNGSE